MRKVAEMVGISAPAIYRHFRNKDDLLNEIVIEGLKLLESYLRPALEAETPYQRLTQMTDNYLNFALEQPRYFDFVFLTASRDTERFAEEIAKSDWGTFKRAVDQVAACMEQGLFAKDDPLGTAITVWAEVHGLVVLFRTGRFGQDADFFQRTYRTSVNRILKGLMANG